MARFISTASLLHLLAVIANADSYIIPPDYGVACLDATTGAVIWTTKPEKLGSPRISAFNGVVLAESQIRERNESMSIDYQFDAKTGKLLPDKRDVADKSQWTLPLKPLPRVLTATDGTQFAFDPGNTRHLISVSHGKQQVIQTLDDYPDDLHIAGQLAIFTFSGGSGGGEVYAYNLKTKAIEWEFNASSKIPNLAEGSYTGIDVEDKHVLVSTDQTLFSLSLDRGQIEWMTKLPRQGIRRYDSPWTTIGRSGDVLFVRCYEDLFALRPEDGKLLWSFDCGPFGSAWPTVTERHVFVGVRETIAELVGSSYVPRTYHNNSAIVVSRDSNAESGFTLEFLSRRQIPHGKNVWWSLHQPPTSPNGSKPNVLLKLIEDFDSRYSETAIDLSEPLRKEDKVYVKFGRWIDKAVLLVDGKPVQTTIKRGSPLERAK